MVIGFRNLLGIAPTTHTNDSRNLTAYAQTAYTALPLEREYRKLHFEKGTYRPKYVERTNVPFGVCMYVRTEPTTGSSHACEETRDVMQ